MQDTETTLGIRLSRFFRDGLATVILRRSRRISSSYVIRKTRSFAAAQDGKTVIGPLRHSLLTVVKIPLSSPFNKGGAVKKSVHASRTARTDSTDENSSTWPFGLSAVEGLRGFFHSFGGKRGICAQRIACVSQCFFPSGDSLRSFKSFI